MAVSYDDSWDFLGLRFAKKRPVTPSTSGELAKYTAVSAPFFGLLMKGRTTATSGAMTRSGLVGLAIVQSDVLAPAFGVIGLILGPLFVICSLEFVGSFEARGWKVASALVPITYIGWSLWLLAMGIALLAS